MLTKCLEICRTTAHAALAFAKKEPHTAAVYSFSTVALTAAIYNGVQQNFGTMAIYLGLSGVNYWLGKNFSKEYQKSREINQYSYHQCIQFIGPRKLKNSFLLPKQNLF